MKPSPMPQRFLKLMAVLALALLVSGAAPAAPPDPSPASGFHDQVVSEYLDGKWEQLETKLAGTKGPAGLSAADRADVETVRRGLAECRPQWWNPIKAGKRLNFRPVVWGRGFAATYDPHGKSSLQLNYVGNETHVTVSWDAADMDNPAHAEHGFSKGELSDLGVWFNLGMAQSWGDIPLGSQVNLNENARLLLTRYLDFRANVTGAYYGSPRARRWALWLDLAAWMEKYAKSPTVMSRRAVGAMFAAEVVGHPERYKSIRLPNSLPDANAEEKLAGELKSWIEKHGMTLAEDESLREAIKAFAAANTGKVRQTGQVTLPNGLTVALTLDADKPDAAKRDAWLKAHLFSKNPSAR